MEAEDDTGTLQQLKASLQLELQRGDGGAKGEEDEDGNGYSSSDFEEEEEITRYESSWRCCNRVWITE